MKKVVKQLNKFNKNNLYKQKHNKQIVKQYKQDFIRQGLNATVNNDFDFIEFYVRKTSYDNMRAIQKMFFETRESLRDLWSVISHTEKRFLLYQELTPFLETLKSFEVDDKRYFITYFDDLFNAYYDHDMLLFDNSAYTKYLYDFKKIVKNDNIYGSEPYKNGFSITEFVMENDEYYVLFSESIKRLYFVGQINFSVGLPLNTTFDQARDISQLVLDNDKTSLLYYLIDNDMCSKRLAKRLVKMKRKLK